MIQESGTGIGNKIYPGKYKEVAAMRILIAEDEEELAKGLKFLLEKNKFSVDVVHDGTEAGTYLGSSLNLSSVCISTTLSGFMALRG